MSPNPDASADETAGPQLRLVRGQATPEEVAALLAVLSAAAASTDPDPDSPPKPRSGWTSRQHAVRRPLSPGPGAWRASALPRA